MKFAKRMSRLKESATLATARKAAELKAQGVDVIDMSLGRPDFDTPQVICEAAKTAIDEGFHHYSPVPGYPSLRNAICTKLKRDNEVTYAPDQIVVSTGAKQSLANLFLALVDEGDEVLLPAPYWVSYRDMVEFVGGSVREIATSAETEYKITPEVLEANLKESKSRLFVFSNPCNPSGAMYSSEELSALAKVFERYPEVLIVSDEIYEMICFGIEHKSMASFPSLYDRVITVGGVSKGHSMTGWRIGFIACSKEIAGACSKIQGQFTSGASSIAQKAAEKAFLTPPSEFSIMQQTFERRRNRLLEGLQSIPGLKVPKPDGAFYMFPDVSAYYGKDFGGKTVNTSAEMSTAILENARVACTPGEAFGQPQSLRLSYAVSDEQIDEVINRFREFFQA